MVVRLRLARHGTKNNPFYHVVAIQDKAARDSRPIEKLGEYDPIPRPRILSSAASTSDRVMDSGLEDEMTVMEKRIEWNADRIKYWISVGAQPSKPVARLLDRAGLIPEGKTFKGIYRPIDSTAQSPLSPAAQTGPLASAILQAAGIDSSKTSQLKDSAAATAMRQDETLHSAEKTNPKEEAMKSGLSESTIDQAA